VRAAELAHAVVAGSNMDLRPGTDGPGIIAFLIVAGLVVVCVLLYRSMRKHLRNIDVDRGGSTASADGPLPGGPDEPPEATGTRQV